VRGKWKIETKSFGNDDFLLPSAASRRGMSTPE